MMQNNYKTPTMDITVFNDYDIITTSADDKSVSEMQSRTFSSDGEAGSSTEAAATHGAVPENEGRSVSAESDGGVSSEQSSDHSSEQESIAENESTAASNVEDADVETYESDQGEWIIDEY